MPLHQKIFLLLVLLLPTQLGRHFWPDWSYVMGLRIDYLSPTIYLTDILVFGILFLWFLEKLRDFRFKFSKSLIFPVSVFVFLLANCFLAQNQGAAIYKLVKIIEFFFLGFYVAKNFSISLYPNILISLSLSVVYSSLIALAQFLKQSSLGGIFWWLGERTFNAGTPGIAKINIGGRLFLRPYATFPHPNVLAGFVLVSFLLSAPVVYRKNKLCFILYTFFFILSLVFSFSRSTWLVGFLIILLVTGRLKKLRLAIFGLAFFSLLILLIKQPIFPEESFSQRMELNKISLHLIKLSPITGIGLNNFIVSLPKFQQGQILWLQPVHNIYLLVAVETGLVGLVIFGWFLILSYKRLLSCYTRYLVIFNKKRDIEISRYQNSLLIALTAILALGLFDHYWLTLQQTQLLLAIVLGLAWGKC